MTASKSFLKDTQASAVISGLIAIVVGWAGPNFLVYSVAHANNLGDATIMSWVWAHTIFTGIASIYLSWRYSMPILSTWSTPGIAFLVTAMQGIPFPEAVGAFLISAVLMLLLGLIKPLESIIKSIPLHIAAALNAAILLPFGFKAMKAMTSQPVLVGAMMAVYFIVRQLSPRWAVAAVLLVGAVLSTTLGLSHNVHVSIMPTVPQFIVPAFSLHATISLAIPLTILAFTGQFVPGFGVLKASGYSPEAAPIFRTCGIASIAAAFFGCHTLTLGAIIINIVSGKDAHPESDKRYTSAMWAGIFNIIFGIFAGTFLQLAGSLPVEAVEALAGIALLSAVGSSLQIGFSGPGGSLAAPVVLLVSLSGITVLGIGAAFWGIIAGLCIFAVEKYLPAKT